MTDHVCRRMETRLCPPSGPCVELCARFESEDPTPWLEGLGKLGIHGMANLFENNDPAPEEEDIKAVAGGPHIMLPPLTDGNEYVLTELPSGRKAVIVQKTQVEPEAKIQFYFDEHDRFGRRKL